MDHELVVPDYKEQADSESPPLGDAGPHIGSGDKAAEAKAKAAETKAKAAEALKTAREKRAALPKGQRRVVDCCCCCFSFILLVQLLSPDITAVPINHGVCDQSADTYDAKTWVCTCDPGWTSADDAWLDNNFCNDRLPLPDCSTMCDMVPATSGPYGGNDVAISCDVSKCIVGTRPSTGDGVHPDGTLACAAGYTTPGMYHGEVNCADPIGPCARTGSPAPPRGPPEASAPTPVTWPCRTISCDCAGNPARWRGAGENGGTAGWDKRQAGVPHAGVQTDIEGARARSVIDGTCSGGTCDCTGTGYTGDYCESGPGLCPDNQCNGRGRCIANNEYNARTAWTCEGCSGGYSGDRCEVPQAPPPPPDREGCGFTGPTGSPGNTLSGCCRCRRGCTGACIGEGVSGQCLGICGRGCTNLDVHPNAQETCAHQYTTCDNTSPGC
jgi:hypothetical protein